MWAPNRDPLANNADPLRIAPPMSLASAATTPSALTGADASSELLGKLRPSHRAQGMHDFHRAPLAGPALLWALAGGRAHAARCLSPIPRALLAASRSRGVRLVVCMLAIAWAGLAFFPLDLGNWPPERCRHVLEPLASAAECGGRRVGGRGGR